MSPICRELRHVGVGYYYMGGWYYEERLTKRQRDSIGLEVGIFTFLRFSLFVSMLVRLEWHESRKVKTKR